LDIVRRNGNYEALEAKSDDIITSESKSELNSKSDKVASDPKSDEVVVEVAPVEVALDAI